MRRVGIYDQIKSAIQDILAPALHTLRADIQRLDQKIDGLDQKMGYMKGEIVAEIRRVDARIDGVHARIDGVERELRIAIDIRERLAALEARRP